MKKNKEILFLIPSILWIFGMTILNFIGSGNIINSDMSAELVLGNELAKTNRIFTTQWFYSTEIRIFYTQIISMILFHFTSSWRLVRTVMNLIFMVGLLLSYLYMTKTMKISKKAQYLSSMFLFIPFSLEYLGIVQIGNSYMPHFIVTFLGIGLLLRLMEKKSIAKMILFELLCLYAGLCGIRYLTILALPVLLAAMLKMIIDNRLEDMKIPVIGALTCMVGAVLNMKVLTIWISVGKNNPLQMSNLAGQGIIGGIDYLLASILRLFGYRDLENVGSMYGIASLAAIVMLVALAVIVAMLLCNYHQYDWKKQFFLLIFAMSFAVNTFIFLFVAGTFVPRFYMPVLVLFAPCMAMYMDGEKMQKHVFHRLVVFGLIVAMNISGLVTSEYCRTSTLNDPFKKVVKYLDENGLTFGVTTFWNTGVINELSNGRIECINVKDENLQEFYGWLTFKKYQKLDTWKNINNDRIFVLLDCGMYEDHLEDSMILDGELVYDDAGYVVLTYDKKMFVEKYSGNYCIE